MGNSGNYRGDNNDTKILGSDGVTEIGNIGDSLKMADTGGGTVDSNNSTSTPLTGSGVYTGTATDVSAYAAITITLHSDVSSVTNGMSFQFSTDGTNWDDNYNFTLDAATSTTRRFDLPVTAQFFRIVYTNGTSAQSELRIQTILHPNATPTIIHRLDDNEQPDRSVTLVKAASMGKTPNNIYVNTRQDGYSDAFSSTSLLLAGETFDSGIVDVSDYNFFSCSINSDVSGILDIIGYDENDVSVFSTAVPYTPSAGLEFFSTLIPTPKGQFIFTNGATDQTKFFLGVKFLKNQLSGHVTRVADPIPNTIYSNITRTKLFAPNASGFFGDIGRNKEGTNYLNVTLDDTDISAVVKQPDNFITGQFNALSTSATPIPLPAGTPSRLEVRNLDTTNTNVFIGSSTVTELTGHAIEPGVPFSTDYNGSNQPYLIAEDDGETVTVSNLDCDTVDVNNGVVNPSNMFASDDNRAIFDTLGDNAEISGIDGTGILGTITSVKLKIEGRKQPSAGDEKMTVVNTTTQSGASTNIVVSPAITGVAGSSMLVCVSVRDIFADVTNIVSTMGHTGFTLVGQANNNNESFTSVYLMDGPTLNGGTITTTFDAFNDHYAITYIQVENLDTSSPIVDVDTDTRAITGAISGSLTTVTDGLVLQVVGSEISEVTGYGAGFSEIANHGSSANNDQRQAVAELEVSSGGAQAWSTTFDQAGDATAVVVSLRPQPALNPQALLSYEVSGVPGATASTFTFTSEIDNTKTLDITSDRAWTSTDLNNMSLLINAPLVGVADLEVDRYWVEVTEATGAVRISYIWTTIS